MSYSKLQNARSCHNIPGRVGGNISSCSYMDEKSNDLKPKYVKILTDSQTALLVLNNIDFKSSRSTRKLPRSRISRSPDAHQRHRDSIYPFVTRSYATQEAPNKDD